MLGFELRGEGLRGGGVVGVVDGDVAAFCGEGAGDFGAEASGGKRVNVGCSLEVVSSREKVERRRVRS